VRFALRLLHAHTLRYVDLPVRYGYGVRRSYVRLHVTRVALDTRVALRLPDFRFAYVLRFTFFLLRLPYIYLYPGFTFTLRFACCAFTYGCLHTFWFRLPFVIAFVLLPLRVYTFTFVPGCWFTAFTRYTRLVTFTRLLHVWLLGLPALRWLPFCPDFVTFAFTIFTYVVDTRLRSTVAVTHGCGLPFTLPPVVVPRARFSLRLCGLRLRGLRFAVWLPHHTVVDVWLPRTGLPVYVWILVVAVAVGCHVCCSRLPFWFAFTLYVDRWILWLHTRCTRTAHTRLVTRCYDAFTVHVPFAFCPTRYVCVRLLYAV